ncbi:MAG: hypothetical protein N3E42_01540 [Candidatus Bipolaricaulota bacterium]|nr:hypothetical protein [Candidatus Bipolaricaulota bacterium]
MNAFLVKELLRTLVTRWRVLAWGVAMILASAFLFSLFAVLTIASGEWGENRLIVLFEPGVSSEQIRQIYRQVREWEAISEVFYISKDDPRYGQDGIEPERAPAGYLRVTVRSRTETGEVESALRDLPGVEAVQSYQKGALRARLVSDANARTLVTGLQLGSALIPALLLVGLVRLLGAAWRAELEILYLSGLPPRAVRMAFVGVTALCALVAGGIAILLAVLVSNTEYISYWVPELLQPGGVGYVSVWVMGVALSVGVGAGLVGAWAVRIK